jgi:hypothetical protein
MKKDLFSVFLGIGIIVLVSGSRTIDSRSSGISDEKTSLLIEHQQKKDTTLKTVYTCSMHPEIVQDKPGKCSKCGMNLTAKEVKKDVYTCPMHSEVVQDKAGKCPKCGMNLVKKETAKNTEPGKK